MQFCPAGSVDSSDEELLDRRTLQVGREALVAIDTFKNVHSTFFSNAALAVSVGFWVAIFSLPSFSNRTKHLVFGEDDTYGFHGANLTANKTGIAHVLKCDFTDLLYQENPYTGEQRWCGILPKNFASYWGNIAQMIIFTVYRNTGTTINLAWQGVVGTILACLNLWMMTLLYPNGAYDPNCNSELLVAGDCQPADPNYSSTVVWIDTLGVLFLFLLSKSAANTIKFGMSWHVYFMMKFMNPSQGVSHGHFSFWGSDRLQYDDESSLVRFTSYAGALIAILVTFVPKPLSNMKELFANSQDVTNSICNIWSSSINYFCSPQDDVQRKLRIEKAIDKLDAKVVGVHGDLDGSWWETANAGHRGNVRNLMMMYDKSSSDIQQIMFTLKSALANAHFDATHLAFYSHMKVPMTDLQSSTAELMKSCLNAIQDGRVDEAEKEDIQICIQEVTARGTMLWQAYGKAAETLTPDDIVCVNASVFALSKWSRSVILLADDVLGAIEYSCNPLWYIGQLAGNLKEGFFATWSPTRIFAGTKITPKFPWLYLNPHLTYCFRNYIPITICFLLGYAGAGEDIAYDATMASTLALLITPYAGGAFQQNTRRLLGVSLGKTLPIILMLIIRSCGEPTLRHIIQWSIIWVFVTMNVYVYYTSLQWSLVGCLMAGFGILPLMKPALDYSESTLASRYKEIGAVVLAIFIQLFSDALLRKTTPRDIVVKELSLMGSELQSASEAYFEGDTDDFEKALESAFKNMETLEDTAPQTDPKLLIAPGYFTPFKMDLLNSALPILKLLLSDFSSLRDCFSDQREQSEELKTLVLQTHERLVARPSVGRVKVQLESMLESTVHIMVKVLSNVNETPVNLRDIHNLPPELAAEQKDIHVAIIQLLSEQAANPGEEKYECLCRHSMAVTSLLNAIKHLHSLQLMFVKENI
eukprot:TRINITY_DN56950_c0_g1_i1.p1 TRINITY_DN56950_c0_g1~~TRINITY_DN56950_c0_g1_i1.p1  ORF type:complete len:927 (-),score=137.92 TRINITY_DN56950_c0_g1_i1:66-2846(-)